MIEAIVQHLTIHWEIYRACLIVSIIDYIGFCFVAYTLKKDYFYWHCFQIPMIILTGLYLGYFNAPQIGGKFYLLHICFFNDILFYLIAGIVNLKRWGWEGRVEALRYLFKEKHVNHSNWTLYARIKRFWIWYLNAVDTFVHVIDTIDGQIIGHEVSKPVEHVYEAPGAMANWIQAGIALLISFIAFS